MHVYKVRGKDEFHMFYELNNEGVRSFGLAAAPHPEGPWRKVSDTHATGKQLGFAGGAEPWTDMVSHGELIRSGNDERMEYEPGRVRWLIQGILRKKYAGFYGNLSWRLGLMERAKPHANATGSLGASLQPSEYRSVVPRAQEKPHPRIGEQAQGGFRRQAGINVAAGSVEERRAGPLRLRSRRDPGPAVSSESAAGPDDARDFPDGCLPAECLADPPGSCFLNPASGTAA